MAGPSDIIGGGVNSVGNRVPSPEYNLNVSEDETGTALAISLAQDAGSMEVWTFDVKVKTSQGEGFLGSFTIRPPAAGDPPSRIVALCFCPGAKNWWITPFGPANAKAVLTMSTSKLSVSGQVPIVPCHGTRIALPTTVGPFFALGQGILTPGPGQVLLLTGFTDPAQPLAYVGIVDKAALVIAGDHFAYAPVQIPAGGANFQIPILVGLLLKNQGRFAVSSAPDPIALGPVATVSAIVA